MLNWVLTYSKRKSSRCVDSWNFFSLRVHFFLLKEPDDLLRGFTWSGSSTPQSLGLSRNSKPRASLSVSNSFSWSWQAFEAYDWEAKRALLDGIVVSFNASPLVGCACGATRRCYIVDEVFLFRAYSISWVSQLTKHTNCQCYWIYFNLIAWLSLISPAR